MTKKLFALTLLFAGLCAAPLALAKGTDKLRQVEEQLSEKQREQQELDTAAQEASKSLNDLRSRMIQATQTLQQKETEQETLEEKLDTLSAQIKEKSKNAKTERAQLTAMVSALVEIASRPPASLFLQDRVTTDHIHRSLLLKAILPALRERTENAARDLVALYDLQQQMSAQKRLVDAAQENLQKQRVALDQMIASRQGLLKRTEEQKAETAHRLATLTEQARDLRQLMEKVSAPRPATPKATLHGLSGLKWPVAGNVRKNFGDRDADGVTSEGLTLAAPSGAPIVAPFSGKVVFAGPFRGYGQIMILQHDHGYHSFLAGFGRIDADVGQEVSAGEPLGVLPVKSGAKPELYFEWRRGEQTLDPTQALGGKAS